MTASPGSADDRPRCVALGVVRIEDRQTLASCDIANFAASAQQKMASDENHPNSGDDVQMSSATKSEFNWASIAAKTAAGLINRTRMQNVDFTNDAADSGGGGGGGGAKQQKHHLHAVVSRPKGVAVAAVCTAATSARTAFVLVDSVLAQFERMFVERASSLTPEQCTEAFRASLADAALKFNTTMAQVSGGAGGGAAAGDDDGASAADPDGRISRVRNAVDQTKTHVLDAIETALDRGGRIDNIVEASADLSQNAETFQRQSQDLERHMWFKQWKTKAIVIGVVLIIVLLIVLAVCGARCLPGGKSGKKK